MLAYDLVHAPKMTFAEFVLPRKDISDVGTNFKSLKCTIKKFNNTHQDINLALLQSTAIGAGLPAQLQCCLIVEQGLFSANE